MKKLLFAAVLFCSLASFANVRVDEVIEKKFKESFPTATSIKWYDNKDSYEVLFVHNNIQCRINYDMEGNMLHMRRDYTKEALPLFITGSIQKRYPGKKIFGVTEITNAEGLQYHIVLEDEKSWFFVESNSGGDLSLNKKLRKS